jgi:hypothetical protein
MTKDVIKYGAIHVDWFRIVGIWYARVLVSGSRYCNWVKLVEFDT